MILNSTKKSLLAAWIGCIGALAALAPASAQTASSPIRVIEKPSGRVKSVDAAKAGSTCPIQALSCGQTVNGSLATSDCTLSDGSYADYYEFTGTNGQVATVTMRSTGVNSYLALINPNHQDVQENDNGAGGNDAQITYQLTSSGQWGVVATSSSSGETGPYTLTLNCSASSGGTAPAAPSRLQATAVSSSEIDLSWQDNSNNETGFSVEQLVNGTFLQIGTVGANITHVGITQLSPQTSYTFQVRALNGSAASAPSNQATATTPAGSGGGSGGYLTSPAIPNFRFRVRIFNTATPISGAEESDCIPETLCVSGAVPGRSEVFLRVIGPRPNGYLWPTIVRFTPSEVQVDVQQISTGITKTYTLPAIPPDSDVLTGLQDRTGFLP